MGKIKKINDTLKRFTIDNIIAGIIGLILYVGSAYLMYINKGSSFNWALFIAFFAGFALFMYNLIVIIGLKNIGYHIRRDIDELSKNKSEK